MTISRITAIVLGTLLLAGCSAAGEWRNPNLPAAQRDADETECRQLAESDMGERSNIAPGEDKYDSPMQMVDRSDLRNQFASLVAECMERKGYLRVSQ